MASFIIIFVIMPLFIDHEIFKNLDNLSIERPYIFAELNGTHSFVLVYLDLQGQPKVSNEIIFDMSQLNFSWQEHNVQYSLKCDNGFDLALAVLNSLMQYGNRAELILCQIHIQKERIKFFMKKFNDAFKDYEHISSATEFVNLTDVHELLLQHNIFDQCLEQLWSYHFEQIAYMNSLKQSLDTRITMQKVSNSIFDVQKILLESYEHLDETRRSLRILRINNCKFKQRLEEILAKTQNPISPEHPCDLDKSNSIDNDMCPYSSTSAIDFDDPFQLNHIVNNFQIELGLEDMWPFAEMPPTTQTSMQGERIEYDDMYTTETASPEPPILKWSSELLRQTCSPDPYVSHYRNGLFKTSNRSDIFADDEELGLVCDARLT